MLARYTADDERLYPSCRREGGIKPLLAVPGMDPVELDDIPADGCWEPVETAPKAPAAAKSAKE